MIDSPPTPLVAGSTVVDDVQVMELEDLYAQGRYLQAYRAAQAYGSLGTWRGIRARLLAARLAGVLGDRRLAGALSFLAWRTYRNDGRAASAYARVVCLRRGPYACLGFLRRHGEVEFSDPKDLAASLALHAQVLAALRDFDRVHEWLAKAEAAAPGDPWVSVEHCRVLTLQDRWDDALALAKDILDRHPGYRPAVEARTFTLVQTGQSQEALSLLRQATETIESGELVSRLVALLIEHQLWDEAADRIERALELLPLLRPRDREWFAALRSDIAYHRGDRAGAIEHARAAKHSEFFQTIADRLATGNSDQTAVLLQVPYVHQHFHTCAPATLASIGPYWSVPIDHLELAESISYDGTPEGKERQWAESHGWVVREFSVTWESAKALLDRGVPFALGTVGATAAHMQAVIGYDAARGTFVVRDPGDPVRRECLALELIESQRANGPRGMAMVPAAEAHRLDELNFPEADLYDRFYALSQALDRHDRAAAGRDHQWLASTFPGHPLVDRASVLIAAYDDDRPALLSCVDRLLERFPGAQALQVRQLTLLRELGRREDRIRLLEHLCSLRDTDPIFRLEYAEELRSDARQWPRAEALLRDVLRVRPQEARAYTTLAALRFDQRRLSEALELSRFATCLAPGDEGLAQRYAYCARLLNRSEEAISLLRMRQDTLGKKSTAPAITLYTALANCGRQVDAFEALDAAMKDGYRGDGTLLLFAAQERARFGERARSHELLAAARDTVRRNNLLRAGARVAEFEGDWERAEELWRELLEIERTSLDALQSLERLITKRKGKAAARAYLGETAARMPHHLGIQRLYVESLRGGEQAAREAALRAILVHHPTDAWTFRELALTLITQGRLAEARENADEALRLEPNSTSSHHISGCVAAAAGKRDEARAALQEAITLSVDNIAAINALMRLCDSRDGTVEALRFLESELKRQTILGDALKAYREAARAVLGADEVITLLHEALRARPDLPQAWSETARQLLDMDRVAEAAALIEDANQRFPFSFELWMQRAGVEQARGNRPGRVKALESAVEIAPTVEEAGQLLASAHEDAGNLADAERVLRDLLRRNPESGANHACLASALWAQGRRQEACESLRQALRLHPTYPWAWAQLRRWSAALGSPDAAETLAREIARERPGDPDAWLAIARELQGLQHTAERLAAIERAVELDPLNAEAHDCRATVLALAGRFDEAVQACSPPEFTGGRPAELHVRHAWVEFWRGNRTEGIRLMKAALEAHPQYVWGWRHLADWNEQTGDLAGALEAAENVVRLNSADARSWARLGELRFALGDGEGGRRALCRAVEIDPTYDQAALDLLDLELREGRLQEANSVYDALRQRTGTEVVFARGVQLAGRQEDRSAAAQRFRQQCAVSTDIDQLRWSFEELRRHGWLEEADLVLDEVVGGERPSESVLVLWARRCVERRCWDRCEQRLFALLENYEVAAAGLAEYMASLARRGGRDPLLRLGMAHDDLLRRHTLLWGAYGYALLQLRERYRCKKWLADWRERKDAAPWMLTNLILALRYLDDWKEARTVGLHVESVVTGDDKPKITLWLALDDALAGNWGELERRLASMATAPQEPYYRCLFEVVRGIHDIERTGKRAFDDVRRSISEALWSVPGYVHEMGLLLAIKRAARGIARSHGGLRARLWQLRMTVSP